MSAVSRPGQPGLPFAGWHVPFRIFLAGLLLGPVFYFVLEPLLMGERYQDLSEHGATIARATITVWLLAVPLAVLALFLLRQARAPRVFPSALALTTSMLIPVVLLNYIFVGASTFGLGRWSLDFAKEVAFLLGFYFLLSAFAAAAVTLLCWLLSALIPKTEGIET